MLHRGELPPAGTRSCWFCYKRLPETVPGAASGEQSEAHRAGSPLSPWPQHICSLLWSLSKSLRWSLKGRLGLGQECMVIHTRDTQSDSINSIITIFITNQEGRLREDRMSYAICMRTHMTYICIHVCVFECACIYTHINVYICLYVYIHTRIQI